MGTSTSILCSPLEPQAMDCSKVCGAETTVVPSTAIACEAAESMRDMLTITWEDDELPGQSTRNIKRVVITNAPGFFCRLSPAAAVPLK
jgi:hypothetical protein